ncbi:MAG TPA: hypothetical protein VL172_14050 [Kofleriaceae bacterium]|nr:hypothetical protein [Kofleriaceae bacterium]
MGRLAWLSLGVVLAIGCGGGKKGPSEPKPMDGGGDAKVDSSLCDTDNKEVESYDLNGDKHADMWKLYKVVKGSRILTCRQGDLNFDGNKDMVMALNDNGNVEFEKIDLDFQKGFDAFYKYEEQPGGRQSLLYEVQRDSNFDGKYDILEKYDSAGKITELQRDSNGDAKPDVWEQYDDGELIAILYDEEPYDGKVDRREEIKKEEPPATPAETPPPADKPDDKNAKPEAAKPATDKPADAGAKKPAPK